MFDFLTRYVTVVRRGHEITLPKKVYDSLVKEHLDISLVKSNGKPSCVQLTTYYNGVQTYCGTLKQRMNVSKFKDGNVCNFHVNNLIKKEK